MRNNNSVKSILIELFKRLNDSDASYAVLRGYEELPNKVSYDIDFCLDPKHLEEVLDIVAQTMVSSGYIRVHSSSRQGFHQVYYYGNDECMKFDFWTAFTFRGLFYLDVATLLGEVKIHNDIVVLNESAELTVSFLKEFLHKGVMREDKIFSLSSKAKEHGFLLEDSCAASMFKRDIYIQKLISAHLDFSPHRREFVKGLFLYNLTKIGILKTVWSILQYGLRFAADKCVRKNFFVVFLGPDGSGKTTMAKFLLDDVVSKQSSFNHGDYIHGRWGFLPNLGRLKGEARGVVTSLKFDTVEYVEPKDHSKLKISTYMGYYFIDYLIGSCKLILNRGENLITVADRYFYDYFIVDHFGNYPRIFEFIYFKLLPSPDLIVYLEVDAEVITARKPELPPEKIRLQQARINKLIMHLPNAVRLTADVKGESQQKLQELIKSKRSSLSGL